MLNMIICVFLPFYFVICNLGGIFMLIVHAFLWVDE